MRARCERVSQSFLVVVLAVVCARQILPERPNFVILFPDDLGWVLPPHIPYTSTLPNSAIKHQREPTPKSNFLQES